MLIALCIFVNQHVCIMGKDNQEKVTLLIRVDKQLAEKVKEAAKRDNRSVSNWGGLVLEEKIKEEGAKGKAP